MIDYIQQIDSTSSELRRLMKTKELPHGYCIATDFQTDGHGQATNRWESEDAKNILFSALLRPTIIPAAEQFIITQLVTIAIVNTLQDTIRQEITIKWPNDIYVGNRKLCGILIENALCGATIDTCIVGVGININQEQFLSDAPNPVSLKQLNGRNNDRVEILEEIHQNILRFYDYLADNWYNENIKQSLYYEYMSHLYRRDGYHKYSTPAGEQFTANIEEIGPQGHLTLRLESGELRTFAFKEVIFDLNI